MESTTTAMLSVAVAGVFAVGMARGRWQPSTGLMLGVIVLVLPLAHLWPDRVLHGSEEWVQLAFRVGLSLLVSVLLSPLYQRVRQAWQNRRQTAGAAH